MTEFFQFLFLWAFGGKQVRQDLHRTLDWQTEIHRRHRQSTQNFIDAIDEIMEDGTADLLASHRRYRAARSL